MTHCSDKIGNVIRILDDRTIIIDAGWDELKEGDIIKVYESLDTLYNLDGSELCKFEKTKDSLKVIDVNERYSVCQKQEIRKQKINFAISPLLEMTETIHVPLNVSSSEISPVRGSDPVIHVGDPVKKA